MGSDDSVTIIQSTPKRSAVIPNRGEKNVGESGIGTSPPSARALKRRSASCSSFAMMESAKPLNEGWPWQWPSDAITSVATSLGALECSPTARRLAEEHPTTACTVTDAEAVGACASFLDEHRVLVEPACGAALALLAAPRHRRLFEPLDSVVVVVCGGSGVDWSIMEQWRRDGLW